MLCDIKNINLHFQYCILKQLGQDIFSLNTCMRQLVHIAIDNHSQYISRDINFKLYLFTTYNCVIFIQQFSVIYLTHSTTYASIKNK